MKKKLITMVLALVITIQPVSAASVSGADFSSGTQDTWVSTPEDLGAGIFVENEESPEAADSGISAEPGNTAEPDDNEEPDNTEEPGNVEAPDDTAEPDNDDFVQETETADVEIFGESETEASEADLPNNPADNAKKDIAACDISIVKKIVCTGKALTPDVTITDNEKVLTADQDYTLEYLNNINPGTATVKIAGIGDYEGEQSKTFKITLAVPEMVSAAAKNYQAIKVQWKAVPGAKSYTLYYKGDTVKTWTELKSGITRTSYVHKSSNEYPLVTGKRYAYTVKAVYDNVSSGYRKKGVKATPKLAAVKLVKTRSVAYNKLKISWRKVAGATGYYILRKEGNSWKRVGRTTGNTFIHTGTSKFPIETGVTYTYSVRAYRISGTYTSKGPINKTGITGKTIPDKVVLADAVCISTSKIKISWNKAAGATDYLIYRKDAQGTWQQIASVSGGNTTSYTHVSSSKYPIETGKTYTYTVRSYTAEGKTLGLYDKKGKSVKALTELELQDAKVRENAREVIAKVTNSDMSQSQKLKACYDWVIKKPYITRREFSNFPGWPAVYANDHFELSGGNCMADASAFAYLASELGYEDVYVCTDSAKTNDDAHGWTEIGGLVYDPLFSEAKNYNKYYGATYRTYGLSPVLRIAI